MPLKTVLEERKQNDKNKCMTGETTEHIVKLVYPCNNLYNTMIISCQ